MNADTQDADLPGRNAMKAGIPWSVKGIGPQAREAAKAAARNSGMTVGEWLNSVILDQSDERPPTGRVFPDDDSGAGTPNSRLGSLKEKLQHIPGAPGQPASERSLETLLARVEANERRSDEAFATVDERLASLGEQFAQWRKKPDSSAVNGLPALTAVETALRNIVEHIEISERHTHETFASLQTRLSEVAAASQRSTPANHIDDNALGKLGDEVALLTDRIEEVRQVSEALAERAQTAAAQAARTEVHDIEIRIEELLSQAQVAMRQTAGASGDLIKVRAEIGGLAQRIDDIKIETASERDVRTLRLSVEQLAQRMEQRPDESLMTEFDRRLSELARRLEQSHGQVAIIPQLQELQQRTLDLEQRFAEAAPPTGGQALIELERQIEGLGERLAANELRLDGIATIERSIGQLYQSLEQTRTTARSTAEETANRAVQHLLEQVPAGEGRAASADLVALEEALAAVQREVQQSDRQTQDTLRAVHETLEQVVDKLAEIEAAQGGQAELSPQAVTEAPGTDEGFEQFPTPPNTWQRAADPPRPEAAPEPLEQVLHAAQFGASQGFAPAPEASPEATAPAMHDDYIAAARRAAKTAAGSRAAIHTGVNELTPRISRATRLFWFPPPRTSRTVNGAAVPVEVLGASRKRLILAGLVLLAAVSAFALRSVYHERGAAQTTTITVPPERATGEGATAPNVPPRKTISPQSWLTEPETFADSDFEELSEVIEGEYSGNAVAHAQSMLRRLGFDVGMANGQMSMKTANAIRLFQLQNGMTVDGEIGAELLTRLEQWQG